MKTYTLRLTEAQMLEVELALEGDYIPEDYAVLDSVRTLVEDAKPDDEITGDQK